MKSVPRDQPCPHCGRFDNRGMAIDALIVKDGKTLLIKRGSEPFKGWWSSPGGYTDWDEDLVGTVKREVREELNVACKIVRLIGIYSRPERHPKQGMTAAFVVEIDGEPQAGDDAEKCKWFDLDSLPRNLAFDHAHIIADYRAGKTGVY